MLSTISQGFCITWVVETIGVLQEACFHEDICLMSYLEITTQTTDSGGNILAMTLGYHSLQLCYGHRDTNSLQFSYDLRVTNSMQLYRVIIQ